MAVDEAAGHFAGYGVKRVLRWEHTDVGYGIQLRFVEEQVYWGDKGMCLHDVVCCASKTSSNVICCTTLNHPE